MTKFYDAIPHDACIFYQESGEAIADALRAGYVDKAWKLCVKP